VVCSLYLPHFWKNGELVLRFPWLRLREARYCGL
jgi:hypothetical protein